MGGAVSKAEQRTIPGRDREIRVQRPPGYNVKVKTGGGFEGETLGRGCESSVQTWEYAGTDIFSN